MSVIDEIKALSRLQVAFVAATAAVTGLAGAAAGYKFAIEKITAQLQADADEALQKEIESAKEFYRVMHKKDAYETPEKALEKLHPAVNSPEVETAVEALLAYSGHDLEAVEEMYVEALTEEPTLRPIAMNVFTDYAEPSDFDYQEELKKRDPERPYLIIAEEFAENPLAYDQVSWTYYSGDGVLANTEEIVVENVDQIIGSHNLTRFGQGSGDPNIVFVRNVKLGMDYEIALSSGKYGEEVGGFLPDEDEINSLRHSSYVPKKFRMYED